MSRGGLSDRLEAAVRDLRQALERDVDEEAIYQGLFESHEEIWRSLGYESAHPHMVMPLPEGERLIPDFIATAPNGLAEIVDLKTPRRRLVRRPGARAQFFAQLESDLAQLRDYQEYFDSPERRQWLEETQGLRITRDPPGTLIVGSGEEDPVEVIRLVRTRSPEPRIITYADVLDALVRDYERHFGHSDRLRASGFFLVGALHALPSHDRYLMDVGMDLDRNRLSLIVSQETVRFEVRDRGKGVWRCEVPVSEMQIGSSWVVHAELGIGPNLTMMTFRVNGQILDRVELGHRLDFDAQVGELPLFIGSDINGENGAAFAAHFLGLPGRSIPLDKRVEMMNYLRETHPRLFSHGELRGDWVTFEEHQFLSTSAHSASAPDNQEGWAACYFAPTLGGAELPAELTWQGSGSAVEARPPGGARGS